MDRRRLYVEYSPPLSPLFSDPPPVPSDPENSVPIQIQIQSKSHHLSPVLLSAAAAVAAFLLLSVAAFVFLYFRRRRRLQQQQQQQLLQQQHPVVAPPPIPNLDDGFFDDDNLGQQHHVWLIRTVGLDEATIRAISAWPFKAGEGLIDSTDCAVCLGEFKDGELLKLLPKCSHAFHAPCIDTWLKSHVNCPLCRAPVVTPKANPALSSSSSATFTVNGSGSTGNSSSNATVHPVDQDSQSLAHLENTQPTFQPPEADRGILDGNEEELGVENRIRIVDPSGISLDENSDSRVPGNLEESGLQPVRRSISMDSLSLGVLLLREDAAESSADKRKELDFFEETLAKNKGKHSNIPKGKKGFIGMERSLSSSGRWCFLSRHGRVGRSSSILPL